MASHFNEKSLERLAGISKDEKITIRVTKEGPMHLGKFLAENVWYCIYAITGRKCFQFHESCSTGENEDMYIEAINKAYELQYELNKRGISAELEKDRVCHYLDIDL